MNRKILSSAVLILAALTLMGVSAMAEDAVKITYDLEYRYDLAQTVYDLTNDLRTGDNAWLWNADDTQKEPVEGLEAFFYDYGLEKAAMERAAELAVFYSHTRPDGSSCFTVRDGMSGENIAAGHGSAEAVVEAWWEEDKPYAGQGHRRNILKAGSTAIGVGCVYADGVFFWVQEFGWTPSEEGQQKFSGPKDMTVFPSKLTDKSNHPGEFALSALSLAIPKGAAADAPVVTITLGWGGTRVTIVDPAWVSSDPAVASVSGGRVTGVTGGTASVSYSAFGQTVTVPVEVLSWPTSVTAPGGILDLSTLKGFDVSRASAWQGGTVTGNVLLTDQSGRVTFKYALSGDDALDLFFDVTVTPADLAALCEAEVADGEYVYTGKEIQAPVTVNLSLNGEKLTLTEGTHYILSYADNVEAGTASVTVTGAGNFTGALETAFEIAPAELGKMTLPYTAKTYTGKAFKPVPKVTAQVGGKTLTLKNKTDYTVAYKNNKAAGKATVTVTGTGNYTGTLTKTFTIKPVKIASVTLEKASMPYTGKAVKPDMTVKATVNGKTVTLKGTRDYTVTYKNNVKAGKATLTVKGRGNFTGTLTKTFTIKPVKIATVTLEKTSMPYTGKAVKPKVTVKARVAGKSVTLKAGTDYTVKYVNNVKAGTAKVIVTGKGNFTGIITKTFKIVKK